MYSFLVLSDRTDFLARFSPFQWYLGGDPLLDGLDWRNAALLAGSFAALVAISIPLFARRDLRG
jgi:ABC-2 type transport system permease protein